MTERDKTQKQKFVEKARELGCDEDEAAFEKRLKRIANAPPHEPKPKTRKKKAPAK